MSFTKVSSLARGKRKKFVDGWSLEQNKIDKENKRDWDIQTGFQYNFSYTPVPVLNRDEEKAAEFERKLKGGYIKCRDGTTFLTFDLGGLQDASSIGSTCKDLLKHEPACQKIARMIIECKAQFSEAASSLSALGVYRPNKLAVGFNKNKECGEPDFNIVVTFVSDAKSSFQAKKILGMCSGEACLALDEPRTMYYKYQHQVTLNYHLKIDEHTDEDLRKYLPLGIFKQALLDLNLKMTQALSPGGLKLANRKSTYWLNKSQYRRYFETNFACIVRRVEADEAPAGAGAYSVVRAFNGGGGGATGSAPPEPASAPEATEPPAPKMPWREIAAQRGGRGRGGGSKANASSDWRTKTSP